MPLFLLMILFSYLLAATVESTLHQFTPQPRAQQLNPVLVFRLKRCNLDLSSTWHSVSDHQRQMACLLMFEILRGQSSIVINMIFMLLSQKQLESFSRHVSGKPTSLPLLHNILPGSTTERMPSFGRRTYGLHCPTLHVRQKFVKNLIHMRYGPRC